MDPPDASRAGLHWRRASATDGKPSIRSTCRSVPVMPDSANCRWRGNWDIPRASIRDTLRIAGRHDLWRSDRAMCPRPAYRSSSRMSNRQRRDVVRKPRTPTHSGFGRCSGPRFPCGSSGSSALRATLASDGPDVGHRAMAALACISALPSAAVAFPITPQRHLVVEPG